MTADTDVEFSPEEIQLLFGKFIAKAELLTSDELNDLLTAAEVRYKASLAESDKFYAGLMFQSRIAIEQSPNADHTQRLQLKLATYRDRFVESYEGGTPSANTLLRFLLLGAVLSGVRVGDMSHWYTSNRILAELGMTDQSINSSSGFIVIGKYVSNNLRGITNGSLPELPQTPNQLG